MKFYFNYSLALLEIQIGRILSGVFFKQKTEKVLYLEIEKLNHEEPFFDYLDVKFADEKNIESEFDTIENTTICGTLLEFVSMNGSGYVRLEDFLKWVFKTQQLLVSSGESLLFVVKTSFEFKQYLPGNYWNPKHKMIKISQGEILEVLGVESERLSVRFTNPELSEIQHFGGEGFLKHLLEGSIVPVYPIMDESGIDGVW